MSTVDASHMNLVGAIADRDSWTAERCSVDKALRVVGTRSAILLLREAYYGATRFDQFARRVGLTDAAAATRLRELVDSGLLLRRPYKDAGQRTRQEYVLTPAGAELVPVLLSLMQWGDRYLADDDGPPLALSHTDCGAPVSVDVRCDAGHHVPLDEISVSRRRRRRKGLAVP